MELQGTFIKYFWAWNYFSELLVNINLTVLKNKRFDDNDNQISEWDAINMSNGLRVAC